MPSTVHLAVDILRSKTFDLKRSCPLGEESPAAKRQKMAVGPDAPVAGPDAPVAGPGAPVAGPCALVVGPGAPVVGPGAPVIGLRRGPRVVCPPKVESRKSKVQQQLRVSVDHE